MCFRNNRKRAPFSFRQKNEAGFPQHDSWWGLHAKTLRCLRVAGLLRSLLWGLFASQMCVGAGYCFLGVVDYVCGCFSSIPALHGRVASRFNKAAANNEKKRATVDFTAQVKIARAILKKSKVNG